MLYQSLLLGPYCEHLSSVLSQTEHRAFPHNKCNSARTPILLHWCNNQQAGNDASAAKLPICQPSLLEICKKTKNLFYFWVVNWKSIKYWSGENQWFQVLEIHNGGQFCYFFLSSCSSQSSRLKFSQRTPEELSFGDGKYLKITRPLYIGNMEISIWRHLNVHIIITLPKAQQTYPGIEWWRDQKFHSRPIPTFFRPNIFETDTKTFFLD